MASGVHQVATKRCPLDHAPEVVRLEIEPQSGSFAGPESRISIASQPVVCSYIPMKIIRYSCLVFAAVLPALLAAPVPQGAKKVSSKGDFLVYVGTYTRQDSKGIYAYRFQPATGRLTSIGLAGESENPSFLTLHPNHQFLYAVNEISNLSLI